MARTKKYKKQKGGTGTIEVNLERRKYYDTFTKECLKGSSGTQIPSIKSNFIYEYDDDTLNELKDTTSPAYQKFMNVFHELNKKYPNFDYKLVISESSQCNPNHWKTEPAADPAHPRIIIFVSCFSNVNINKNNFGPANIKGKWIPNEIKECGIKKNLYYFGFNGIVHLHNGEIYVCKDQYTGATPKLTCDSPLIKDTLVDCCKAKKDHFTSMFIEALKTRNCLKITDSELAQKTSELGDILDKQSEERLTILLKKQDEGFFSLTGNTNCQNEGNPCDIKNPFSKAAATSIAFNAKAASERPPISDELLEKAFDKNARQTDFDAIAKAIDEGADVNTRYSDEPFIWHAIYLSNDKESTWLPLIKILLEKGAIVDPGTWRTYLTFSDYNNIIKLFYTIRPELMIMEYKMDPLYITDDNNEYLLTHLEISIVEKNKELVRFFLENGVKLPRYPKASVNDAVRNEAIGEAERREFLTRLLAQSDVSTVKILVNHGLTPIQDDIERLSLLPNTRPIIELFLILKNDLLNQNVIDVLKRYPNSAELGNELQNYYDLYIALILLQDKEDENTNFRRLSVFDQIKELVERKGVSVHGKYGIVPLDLARQCVRREKNQKKIMCEEIVQYFEGKKRENFEQRELNKGFRGAQSIRNRTLRRGGRRDKKRTYRRRKN